METRLRSGLLVVSLVMLLEPTLLGRQLERSGSVISEDLSLERIADDVWVHTSSVELTGYGRVPANGLLVTSEGEAVLIDTPWTNPQTEHLLDWVRENLDVRVTKVVVTHSHQDCLGGLSALDAAGVASYALEQTAALAREAGLPVPQNTFAETLDLEIGSRKLEIRFVGRGHAPDNIVVWIPDQKVLFGGCLVKAASAANLGNIREADLDAWPGSIRNLLSRYGDARIIVPGHGRPGGIELLLHTLELFRAAGHTSSASPLDPRVLRFGHNHEANIILRSDPRRCFDPRLQSVHTA